MNLYPWVEMVVFSELCAYGHYSTMLQEFQIFEQEMPNHGPKNTGSGFTGSSLWKKIWQIQYSFCINPQGEIGGGGG